MNCLLAGETATSTDFSVSLSTIEAGVTGGPRCFSSCSSQPISSRESIVNIAAHTSPPIPNLRVKLVVANVSTRGTSTARGVFQQSRLPRRSVYRCSSSSSLLLLTRYISPSASTYFTFGLIVRKPLESRDARFAYSRGSVTAHLQRVAGLVATLLLGYPPFARVYSNGEGKPSPATACSARNPHCVHITPMVGRMGPPMVSFSTSRVSGLLMYASRTFQVLSPQRGQGSVTPR
jgi:hypothetical protein